MAALSICGSNLLLCQQVFEVDLNDRSDDTFKVTLFPASLADSNAVFQFASTAPGTYQEMDIGRFVRDFRAFDGSGKEVPVKHLSTNQWRIPHTRNVKKITYAVEDIWNTKVDEHPVFQMAGTTLSDDFVMLNGQCVFGYFSGMQTEPIRIKLRYPAEWKVGTALRKDTSGYYDAEDFDKVVDSPFYLGNLSTATATIGGAVIDVFTYSKSGMLTSGMMLDQLRPILNAESDFTRGLPVDRYVFLFHFGSTGAGAWEHSYSSEYVLKEETLSPATSKAIGAIVAHEFFHVNVPLNIHSELVEHFNFVHPVMSQHLWLYEGTTEWAARILQLRDGLMTLDQYLQTLRGEVLANDAFDPGVSLTSLGVHSTEMQDQYLNIYQKGALVSSLLDIRLLQLSHGKTGLREVLLTLSKEFGKAHPFGEDTFFDHLVAMTYPEIGDFINRYIKGTEQLPLREYFSWLGIDYTEIGSVDSSKGALGIGTHGFEGGFGVSKVFDDSKSGLMRGDIIEKIDGTPLTFDNAQTLFGRIVERKPGERVEITVKREGKEIDVSSILTPRVARHVFRIDPDATAGQQALRMVWMKNM